MIFCLSFFLTIIPVFIIDKDNLPEEVKFNITEDNICFWEGSSGLLDDCNPCPYRGYIGNDQVIDNNGVFEPEGAKKPP